MRILACISLSSLLFLSSCFLEQQIVDDISMVTVIGFDKGEDDKILATITVPFYQSNTQVINKIYHTEAYFTKDAIDLGSSKSEYPMVIAQNEVLIFSKALAEEGLMKYLDSYQRDPSISTRLYVAMAKDQSAPLLVSEDPTSKDLGVLIGRMFTHNIQKNFLPQTNLHVFLFDYYQEGKDPFLPIIKKEEGLYAIDGISFFEDSQYKGRINYGYDAMVFRQMRESFSHGSYTFKLQEGQLASIQNISSRKHVKVKNLETTPTIHITINMSGFMREYSGTKVNDKIIKEVTEKMETDFKERSKQLIAQFKEWEVDPLGLGNEIRKNKRGWKASEWEDIYNKVNVEIDINITIKETGVTS